MSSVLSNVAIDRAGTKRRGASRRAYPGAASAGGSTRLGARRLRVGRALPVRQHGRPARSARSAI